MTALLACTAYCSAALNAEEKEEFNGHWYVQVQGGIGHTVGETSFGRLISPAAAFNFGYRFTPVWGLRAGIGGWEAKGALAGPASVYGFNYLQGSVDMTADICGIFAGYRAGRALNPYLFAGVGLNGRFNNAEAQAQASRFPSDGYLWDGAKVSPVGRFGIGAGIRISDVVQFNLELGANFLSDRFNSKRGSAVDWQLGASAGFTFNIGLRKTARKPASAPEYVPTPAATPAVETEQEQEPAPAKRESALEAGAGSAVEQAAPAFETMEKNVYFTIGRSDISSGELTKIQELAEILRENHGTAVTVTGHADAGTGSAERNMALSKERAENVAAALEAAGVEPSRISVRYAGDTDNRFDSPERNRVAICVVAAR